ncbi:MAG TPA: VWA domain-containing protein [Blastocatellia bacterium]|nr:VWA domain-containing protein [Blastocatellia bacterium]
MNLPVTVASLLPNTLLFCRALRERGLAVTPSEAIDTVATLECIDLDDRREVFLSLRSVLVSRVEDYPIFEELFEDFWNRKVRGKQERKASDTEDRSRLSSPRQAGKGLAFFLEHWGANQSGSDPPVNLPVASDTASLAEKDFSRFVEDELEEVSRLARRIVRRLARRPSRRWEPARRGPRVLLRRALRRSLSAGGEVIELWFRRRRPRKTRLVVISDVSGSMDSYSRVLLQFVYGLQNSFARVETFVFSTSLERITPYLKRKDYRQALDLLSRNVRGWSGGTLIGASLAAFIDGWLKLIDKRTIVIIMSDGWDTGEPEVLARAVAELHRRAGRLIWLNPLLGSAAYQPLVRGMQAALPFIDVFAPLHNLASLKALEQHLVL